MSRRVELRNQELLEVEARLQRTLQPIPPRAEFVGSLRSQLLGQLQEIISWMLISGVFLLVISIRVVMFIFVAFSLLRKLQKRSA